MKGEASAIRHIVHAARYSMDGFVAAFKDEVAFRLVCCESLVMITVASMVASAWSTWVLLVLPSVLSIVVELLNSALENTVDRISLEPHILAKKAKDMGSAAQCVAQCFVFGTWIVFLLD
ncbi:MAG: diacylglycerol kinase [Desulfovibrionaceae bacterium]|nr:diacylglycerol kinase [Desulfovibrionaceae bacterium]